MFEKFLRGLLAPSPAPLPETEARLALTALLVRVARADHHYSEPEVDRIDRVLMQRYGLSPFEAAKLRVEAETLESEAPDTVRFTRALKEAVPIEERTALMQALWSVALADGDRASEEEQLLRMVARLLGLTDPENALARQRAARGAE
ncbi:TerB family tellurite resistance protein [Aliigemmobacter aestuarii]|uniref:TerB family tellurite resistance protein n=1 Tax=Aliigemmobacter aestuarii TaxID=1445661 RepID=A0A4S3MQ29_9RHOB|nr:TerB family tellurite resistance protein [Gemmobacter aestuarii]THD84606.1 TerB family tellurite resistance protein [Gemmobacter aestuarii]